LGERRFYSAVPLLFYFSYDTVLKSDEAAVAIGIVVFGVTM